MVIVTAGFKVIRFNQFDFFLPRQTRVCFRIYCLDGLPCGFWAGRITRVQDVRKPDSVDLDQCGSCRGKPSVFQLTCRQRKWGKTDSQVKSWEKISSEWLFASVKVSVVNRELNKSVEHIQLWELKVINRWEILYADLHTYIWAEKQDVR